MDKIRISVKGDADQTALEMARRGVIGTLVGEGRFNTTLWDVSKTAHPKLVSWFCEPAVCSMETGFPVGTLLHHS